MLITTGEVAIILVLPIKQTKLTPARYSGILVGVCDKMTIKRGLEGVG